MSLIPNPYKYDGNYIVLPDLELNGLPDEVQVEDYGLRKKSEFHISLICAKKLALLINKVDVEKIQTEIDEQFSRFVARRSLTDFKILPELRFVQRDERKTIIVMVKLKHLKEFFNELGAKYQTEIPDQPTHITLYTLQPKSGIGIMATEELESDSRPVEIPKLKVLWQ